MNRCRHCLTPAKSDSDHCCVCGIERATAKQALSPDERKVRFHARTIRVIAMLHLIGASVGVMVALTHPSIAGAAAVLAIINLALAVGLSRFAFWSYILAVVYYFLIGMVNIVSVNIPGSLVILILLYAVGNGTAKAIFQRQTR